MLKNCFFKDKKGATAIEFALIAAPFFAIIFAIIELALVFWVNGILIEAINQPTRSVLVGEKIDQKLFRKAICDKVNIFIDCNALMIDMRSYDTFSSIGKTVLIDPKTGEPLPVKFDQGKGGDIVVVRVGYVWQLMVPFLHSMTFNLSNMSGNRRLIQATNVFKNEPFHE